MIKNANFPYSQGQGPYTKVIKAVEEDITKTVQRVNELTGIKESDTGLAPPALWDLAADKQTLQNDQPLQVCSISYILLLSFASVFATNSVERSSNCSTSTQTFLK